MFLDMYRLNQYSSSSVLALLLELDNDISHRVMMILLVKCQAYATCLQVVWMDHMSLKHRQKESFELFI